MPAMQASPPHSAESASPDPFQALTLEEAAALAGVGLEELVGRIESGDLLHERGPGGERIVRRVDLAEAWPELGLLGGQGVTEEVTAPDPEPAPLSPTVSSPLGARDESSSGEGGSHAADASQRSRVHALEVRLAALQATGDALRRQVRDLELQRGELKDHCAELKGRMALIERERQAGTAGLLLAQRRLLELEAARPAAPQVGVPSRGVIWSLAGLFILVASLGGLEWSQARAAQRNSSHRGALLAQELEKQEAERREWQRASAALQAELERQERARREERAALEKALEEREARLRAEREETRIARAAFDQRLNASLEANAEAIQKAAEARLALERSLREESDALRGALEQEQAASREERVRFRALLEEQQRASLEREDRLREELAAARQRGEELLGVVEPLAQRLEVLEARQRLDEAQRIVMGVLRYLLMPGSRSGSRR